jgi:hypothetical protein
LATWLRSSANWKLTTYSAQYGTGAGHAACYFDDLKQGITLVVYENAGPDRSENPVNLGAVIVHSQGVPAVPEPGLAAAPELSGACPKI